MAKKVTMADFLQGPGMPKTSGIYSMGRVIELVYGSFDNFYQCEFVHKSAIEKAYSTAKTAAEKWNAIRRYYEFVQPQIECAEPTVWAVVYDLPFERDFTPIEDYAWQCMRTYDVVMYPQYPVLNYFVDFANPKLKLAVEMDGSAFHDVAKDAQRDKALRQHGWTVYRIRGAECYVKLDHPEDLEEREGGDSEERRRVLHDWYTQTAEGVICALSQVYFKRHICYGRACPEYAHKTLRLHQALGV